MKHENKWKMRDIKVLMALDDKNPWKKFEGKWHKIVLWILTDRRERERERERERKSFWKSLNRDRTCENLRFKKKLPVRFLIDRKIDLINWKLPSIDRAAIESGRFKQNF